MRNGNSSLATLDNRVLIQVWSLFSFDNRPRLNGRAVFPHSVVYFILFYYVQLLSLQISKLLRIQIPRIFCLLADIYSFMLVYFHFCPCSFQPITINRVERVKGRVNTGTFTWVLSSLKVQDIFHKRTRNTDLTKCCQQCLLDENCRYNVENSSEQRLPVNNLLRSHLYPKNLPWESKSCPGNTTDREDGAVSPQSMVDWLIVVRV